MAKEKKEQKDKKDPKDERITELTETLQRLQAEFENYRKRIEKEKQDFARIASKELIVKLLPILDNFELALKNKECNEEFVKGVELIFSELWQVLSDEGLKKIEAKGKFDPYTQEALLAEESDKEQDTVLEVLQDGFMLNDNVIRHAKVKVAKRIKKEDKK